MTANKTLSTTVVGSSLSASAWKLAEGLQNKSQSTDTRGISSDGKLMLQGRIVTNPRGGGKQVVVTVDPIAIDRKLAIRRMNERLEGHSLRSDTYAKVRR